MEKKRDRYKSPKIYLLALYHTIDSRIKHNPSYQGYELLPRDEFLRFGLESETFHKLFQEFKEGGLQRGCAPSVDRVDPNRGYSLDNIRWMTMKANSARVHQPFIRIVFGIKLELLS